MTTLKAFAGYVESRYDGSLKTVKFVPQVDGDETYMGVWVDETMADDISTPAGFEREYGTLFLSVADFKKDAPVQIADYWAE